MRKNLYPLPLPRYAVDLLMAAKAILANEHLTSTGDERLGLAVEAFEDNMPLTVYGDIVEMPAVENGEARGHD